MGADLAVLEQSIAYSFRDQNCLVRALTHKSRTFEKAGASPDDPSGHNEQLEFLGDAILGFIISDYLLAAYPLFPEGKLSKLKAQLVSASHLFTVAQRLGLGGHLLLGRGEEMSGGRDKRALLSNAVEAIIAAMYLDGGIDPVRRFVETAVVADFSPEDAVHYLATTDFKSALQERAQSLGLPQPQYRIIAEHGPEHAKRFTVEARIGKKFVSHADGMSKKSAGQRAAERMLRAIDEDAAAS